MNPTDPLPAGTDTRRLEPGALGVWLLMAIYTVTFCALSLRRYDAYLMHALDMGNMEQAIWNTIHGAPFRFTNMRAHIDVEAFGTTTRLSFHVEPILVPLSVLHLVYPGPQMLLVVQTLVLASGAYPAYRMARRHLPGSLMAELAFPLAYLLFPALQAANLYEFHAVTFTAALLLWAFDYADQGRPLPFVLFGLAAMGCKEEIGLLVALLALWSTRRRMPWRMALLLAVMAAAWSLIAVLVIVPTAQHAQHSTITSSPYLTRYLAQNLTAPGHYEQVTPGDVLRAWLQHPERLMHTVLGSPKRGFLQRLFAPVAYLSLLDPLALAVSLPSFGLILLSHDQHMYGGLGHYSAEFVGIMIASAILGLSGLARFVERYGGSRRYVATAGSLFLLGMALANARVNGFAPFTGGFEWPAITEHVQLADRMISLIPPQAAVSAQDDLDPHLSDRRSIFLFPDITGAEYVALDVSANPTPTDPGHEHQLVQAMLQSRWWEVLFARDGLLLLHHRRVQTPRVPLLPAAFYSFALPSHPTIAHHLELAVGPDLRLIGYTLSRRETVNLRVPDVVLTTYWEATARVPRPVRLTMYLTDVQGRLRDVFGEDGATAWLPVISWPRDTIVRVDSVPMGVGETTPGDVRACISARLVQSKLLVPGHWLPLRLIRSTPTSGYFRVQADDQALCLGAIPVRY